MLFSGLRRQGELVGQEGQRLYITVFSSPMRHLKTCPGNPMLTHQDWLDSKKSPLSEEEGGGEVVLHNFFFCPLSTAERRLAVI